MDFWMSSEKHISVNEAVTGARKAVEPIIAELIKDVELSCGAAKWSVISIVMPDERVGDYPEVRRYHKSSKDIELRVQLPYNEFKSSNGAGQINIMLDSLARSVDLMGEIKSLKLTGDDAFILKNSVEKARLKLNS
ncbi:hypothetical protein [Pantoea sp. Cy-639]|uniref:hypothetical protein n=1 Tax=Pantoea sp. Cy-639 TaxID=2608360 RepID=UPI001421A3D7|nr:hypothetical protein [Pantoea sp. Cy-639]NIF18570.1 hypothetical protein [Pantoea sp. Cy-639]